MLGFGPIGATPVAAIPESSTERVVPAKETAASDSSAWTGLLETIINARNAAQISRMIGLALDSLPSSDAGNAETMQAVAYLKAARELVDAPEPPSQLIWQLISKAADVVGLVGLFYTIFVQATC